MINKLISFQNGKQHSKLFNKLKNEILTNSKDSRPAEDIAVSALTYLANDPELLSRFLALSGIDPAHMRDAAKEPGFLCGVLDFYLGFEPTLMEFSKATNINPEDVVKARAILGPNETDYA